MKKRKGVALARRKLAGLRNAKVSNQTSKTIKSETAEAMNPMHRAASSQESLEAQESPQNISQDIPRVIRDEHGNSRGNPNTAPRCGARTRQGRPCMAPAIKGKRRCRLHGGKSTGPRTPEGLERSRRARWKHGRYSQQAREARWNDPVYIDGLRQAAMRRMERESKREARKQTAAWRAALRRFGL